MVAVAFGVLVVAALGAAVLVRQTAADSAIADLRARAPRVAVGVDRIGAEIRRSANPVGTVRLRRSLVGLLDASGTTLFGINADGSVTPGIGPLLGRAGGPGADTLLDLPADLRVRDLDLVGLLAGATESGVQGDRAYVAVPLEPVGEVTPVVVLSGAVERRPLGRAGTYLLLTGCVALAAAVLVGVPLARRLTRPLGALRDATNAIAAGDLTARVDPDGMPDDELADLTRSFNAMAAELETARGLERSFLLSVSHDLRTPLTSIRGYAEAIGDGTVSGPEDLARAAAVIGTESGRLERLVADLLDLARLDAHAFSLTPRPIDARDVVARTVAGFEPAARTFGVTLRVVDGPPVPADADPERLAQIVANLVENALRHARAQVDVAVTRSDAGVELRVTDDGPGIAAEDRDRVFDRLYSARAATGRPVGTGLGLAIVRELARTMGGSVEVGPDAGGAVLVVRIAG
jgi:signal transduction histidine kinase